MDESIHCIKNACSKNRRVGIFDRRNKNRKNRLFGHNTDPWYEIHNLRKQILVRIMYTLKQDGRCGCFVDMDKILVTNTYGHLLNIHCTTHLTDLHTALPALEVQLNENVYRYIGMGTYWILYCRYTMWTQSHTSFTFLYPLYTWLLTTWFTEKQTFLIKFHITLISSTLLKK